MMFAATTLVFVSLGFTYMALAEISAHESAQKAEQFLRDYAASFAPRFLRIENKS